ncbi:hypothetical protein A966_00270 [Brachyspira hampsonii 30446]|uniref:Uncharacterized protein n=2 Tax=Brachyspira hampsonii TaxID=1287055 RepID=A0A2U4FLI4_9SPIR|nr:hypothetical protein [Brachyspira hampsonii]EKV58371.1 hypothetical protein A966_00270 [Brachyspira hampsonii 30446]OEJ20530.1 hypothetical protein A9495_11495 [Brachyspira hampsonii]
MNIIRILISHIIFFIISYISILILSIFNIINIYDIDKVNDIIFTSIGIIFSIGFTIILSFNLENINNEDGFKIVKDNLYKISFFSLILFTLSLVVFILSKILIIKSHENIKYINSIFLSLLFIFLSSLSYNYKRLFDMKLNIIEQFYKEKKELYIKTKTDEIIEKNKK